MEIINVLILFILIAISVLIVGGTFIFGYLRWHEHNPSLPELNIERLLIEKQIQLTHPLRTLFIYPHPDDESVFSGGLIAHLSTNRDYKVKVISVTRGEGGDEILKLSPEKIADVRQREFSKAMKILGVIDYEIWNFPDGKLKDLSDSLLERLRHEDITGQYDLIVTYEKGGIYGHPDHLVLSEIVYNLTRDNPRQLVLYSTTTYKKFMNMDMPAEIAGTKLKPDYLSNPEYKLSTLRYNWVKFRAMSVYKSQNLRHFTKPKFVLSEIYEYYTTKYN